MSLSSENRSGSFLDLLDSGGGKPCVAIIGGGGKTSLLLRLGDELLSQTDQPSILLASLTQMPVSRVDNAIPVNQLLEIGIPEMMRRHNPLLVLGPSISDKKIAGLSNDELNEIRQPFDSCIFECDGARGLPLKAHNQRDPIIPEYSTQAIVLVGADVVGTRVNDGLVHRPDLFCETWNCDYDTVLNAQIIAEILTSKQGYHQKIPGSIQTRYLVNKADGYPDQASELGKAIAQRDPGSVWIGSLREEWLESVQ
jgi:probable selenium-dependent hydroxylase accessory protein YqeC